MSKETKQCSVCKIDFQSDLINDLNSSDGSYPACPVCALKAINTIHGLPMSTPFRGGMANVKYLMAVDFLKKTNQWSNPDGLPE